MLKVPPKLILQVWDNDKFSADDFLGEGKSVQPRRGRWDRRGGVTLLPAGVLELELTRLPRPAQRPQDCALKPRLSPWPWGRIGGPPHFSLFRQKQARGWWPCVVHEGGTRRMAVRRGRGGSGIWWGGGKQGNTSCPRIHLLLLLQGKLELSLELLSEKEAEERPAGKGREEPNAYPTLQPPV